MKKPRRSLEESELDKIIGKYLRYIRMARNLPASVFAEMIGVSLQQLVKYENGTNRVSVSKLFIIIKALDISIIDFFQDMNSHKGIFSVITKENETYISTLKTFLEIKNSKLKRGIISLIKATLKQDNKDHENSKQKKNKKNDQHQVES
jgi:transcriptional regulator with XRE-family HTH domain